MFEEQVYIVDDDWSVRETLRIPLKNAGFGVHTFVSGRQFLKDPEPKSGCLILDVRLPDMNGLKLQEEIIRRQENLKIVVITAHADIATALAAMKGGAVDFLEKPYSNQKLLASVRHALGAAIDTRCDQIEARKALEKLALLTLREQEVLKKIGSGCSNKIVAYELGISPRTVECHRTRIMQKLNASGLRDLMRITYAANKTAA